MTKTYHISGMTCNNCKALVIETLEALPAVKTVSVNLKRAHATIETIENVNIEQFRDVLPNKYEISEVDTVTTETEEDYLKKSELRQLFPLFLIFAYVTISSFLLNVKPWSISAFMLDFMGLFYIVFSFFKLLDLKGFAQSFQMYDPLARALPIYKYVYPFIEVVLGIALLYRFQIKIALLLTFLILGVTTIGVTRVLQKNTKIRCACLGTVLQLPMTKATLIENSIMIMMAMVMFLKLYL